MKVTYSLVADAGGLFAVPHGLYPEYAEISWNFLKHYSRDLTTGEVIYRPYVQ